MKQLLTKMIRAALVVAAAFLLSGGDLKAQYYQAVATGNWGELSVWREFANSGAYTVTASTSGTTLTSASGSNLDDILDVGDVILTSTGGYVGIVASFSGNNAVLSYNARSNITTAAAILYTGDAQPAAIPNATNAKVVVGSGVTLTLDGDYTCQTLTLAGGSAATSLVFAGKTLTVTEDAQIWPPTATSVTNTIDVGDGTLNVRTFRTASTDNDTKICRLVVNNGTINARESLSPDFNTTRNKVDLTGSATITVGREINQGSFTLGNATITTGGAFKPGAVTDYGTSKVIIKGIDPHQIINTFGLYDLEIQNLAQIGLGDMNPRTVTINHNLSLAAPVYLVNNHKLEITAPATITADGGFGTSKMICTNGNEVLLRKGTVPNDFTFTYPIGNNDAYLPVVIASVSSAGASPSLGFATSGSKTPLTTGSNVLGRTWKVSVNNVSGITGTLAYNNDEVTGDESSYKVYQYVGGVWVEVVGASVNAANNTIDLTGVTLVSGLLSAGEEGSMTVPSGYIYTLNAGNWNATGTWSGGAIPTAADNVLLLHNVGVNQNVDVKDLVVSNGVYINMGGSYNLTVNGETRVYGVFRESSGAGNDIFAGKITVYEGGTLDISGPDALSECDIRGGIENHGTFTGRNATFSTNNQTVSGTADVYFSSDIAVNVELTNEVASPNGLYVYRNSAAAISGSGKLINEGVLNYSGSADFTVANHDFSAVGNTVIYSFSNNSTIRTGTYHNLIVRNNDMFWGRTRILGTGDLTVNGDLTVAGNTISTITLQCANVTQNITVKGNLTIENATASLGVSGSGTYAGTLDVGGNIVNNGTITLYNSNARYNNLVVSGAGAMVSGSGYFNLANLSFTGGNAKTVEIDSVMNFNYDNVDNRGDLANTGGALTFSKGKVTFVRDAAITGTGITLHNLQLGTGTGSDVNLKMNNDLVVNGTLNMILNTGGDNYMELQANKLTVNGDYIWTKSGRFYGTSASSLTFNGSGNLSGLLQFATGGDSLANLVINRSGTVTLGNDLKIKSKLTMTRGALDLGGKQLIYDPAAQLEYNGTSGQTQGPELPAVMNNLVVISNTSTGGVALSQHTTLSKGLTLGGLLKMGDYNLLISDPSLVSGAYNSNRAIVQEGNGLLSYTIASTGTYVFPLAASNSPLKAGGPGTSYAYSPLSLGLTALTGSGEFTVGVSRGKHPQYADEDNYIAKYWTLSKTTGITAFTANVQCTYVNGDVTGTEDQIYSALYDGQAWGIYEATQISGNVLGYTVSKTGDFTGVTPKPDVSFTTTALAFGTVGIDTTAVLTHNVSGSQLIENLLLTAPSGYTLSDAADGTYAATLTLNREAGGTLSSTPVYVKFSPTGVGTTYNGDLTHTMTGFSASRSLTGTGGEANAAPTDISLSASSLAENTVAGQLVATLSATDANSADTHTYTLVAGEGDANNSMFVISGNELKVATVANYEADAALNIRIRITDSGVGRKTYEEAIEISVTDVNETPTNISLDNLFMAENQASGTQVGSLSTTDPDGSETFTYSLVAGQGDTDNASFTIDGDKLKTAASFDFETRNSYTVRVRTTDKGSLFYEKSLQITVQNANEAPTVANAIPDQNATAQIAFNYAFAANTFADPDAATTLTYTATLSNNNPLPAWCTFTAATRTFSGTPSALDAGTITVKVTASDGTLSVSDEFTITIGTNAVAQTRLSVVSVYPNPTTEVLHVKMPVERQAEYRIFNTSGTLVLFEKASAIEHTLNVSGLAKGTYILVVTDGEREYRQPVVKQ